MSMLVRISLSLVKPSPKPGASSGETNKIPQGSRPRGLVLSDLRRGGHKPSSDVGLVLEIGVLGHALTVTRRLNVMVATKVGSTPFILSERTHHLKSSPFTHATHTSGILSLLPPSSLVELYNPASMLSPAVTTLHVLVDWRPVANSSHLICFSS